MASTKQFSKTIGVPHLRVVEDLGKFTLSHLACCLGEGCSHNNGIHMTKPKASGLSVNKGALQPAPGPCYIVVPGCSCEQTTVHVAVQTHPWWKGGIVVRHW